MRKSFAFSCALAAVLLVACAAFADILPKTTSATRDIVLVEEETDAASGDQGGADVAAGLGVEEMHNRDFTLSLSSNRAAEGDVFAVGDKLVLSFTSDRDCRITLLDFTPGGRIVVLFPNKWVQDNAVKAGQTVLIPAEGQKFSMKIGGPAGVDVVKAIATNRDVQIVDPANAQLAGPFAVLRDVRAATRDILLVEEEVSASPDVEPLEWAAATLAVLTKGEQPGEGGFGVAQKGDWIVKMWLDRGSFLTGEPMFVKFQSTRGAQVVSLVDKGTSGKENVMLPAGVTADVLPGDVTILPGKEHKWKLIATTPAGQDVVTARLKDGQGEEIEISLSVSVTE